MYPRFAEGLKRRHGDAAFELRHELFFQQERWPPGTRTARALGALVRDAQLLTRPAKASPEALQSDILLVTTLAGASGWGTIARALPAIARAGLRTAILAHPRLESIRWPSELPLVRPGGLGAGAIGKAALDFPVSPVLAARARRSLWIAAIRGTLRGWNGTFLLHNDFDMMSATCAALSDRTICLQHGLPTDEFFPCRAGHQVVWGETSAAAYRQGGLDTSRIVVDGLDRQSGANIRDPAGPERIAVVSQTHATIFGREFPGLLQQWVEQLHARHAGLLVLLHPFEIKSHPYRTLPAESISRPPHALFSGRQGGALVMAHCSTALLDAALAGHWVGGITLDLPGNRPAHLVGDPPLMAATPAEAEQLFLRLRNDAGFRLQAASDIDEWLAATISADDGTRLTELLRTAARR